MLWRNQDQSNRYHTLRRKIPAMKRLLVPLLIPLAACTFGPTWHWVKDGTTDAQYTQDLNHCKAATYTSADGIVTKETVRRMHTCMETLGWRKEPN